MRRVIAAAVLTVAMVWLAVLARPHAQMMGMQTGVSGTVAGYSGPGDVVASATGWWGLRAYSAAYAASTGPAVDIACNTGFGSTSTINVLTTGALDQAALISNCTTSTVTGNISGTALTVTSGPALLVGQTILGTGVTPQTTITSTTGGGSPYTVSNSQTVLSETLSALDPIIAKKAYDQTGAGDFLTFPSAYYIIVQCGPNNLPCFYNSGGHAYSNSGSNTINQPFTYSIVFNASSLGTKGVLVSGSTNGSQVYTTTSGGNSVVSNAGTALATSAATATWYAGQFVVNNTSSVNYINGSSTSGTAGTGIISGYICFNGDNSNCSGDSYNGYMTELGIWSSAFSSGQQSSMNSNQRAYWGF